MVFLEAGHVAMTLLLFSHVVVLFLSRARHRLSADRSNPLQGYPLSRLLVGGPSQNSHITPQLTTNNFYSIGQSMTRNSSQQKRIFSVTVKILITKKKKT